MKWFIRIGCSANSNLREFDIIEADTKEEAESIAYDDALTTIQNHMIVYYDGEEGGLDFPVYGQDYCYEWDVLYKVEPYDSKVHDSYLL